MSHHVPSVRTYLLVFVALMIGTAFTVWIAYRDLGPWNNLVAMAVAAAKASLVVLYFMNVKASTRLTKLTIVSSLVFLVILIGFVLVDVGSRDFLVLPGREF